MPPIDSVHLHNIIIEYYDQDELKTMCFHLGLEYEKLDGDSKADKVLSLIKHMQRKDLLDELLEYVYETQPSITQYSLLPHVKMEDNSKPFRGGKELLEETALPKDKPVDEALRLDTAYPAQVQPDRSFELAIAIRQTESPSLQEEGLDQSKSGNLHVEWPEGANSAALRIHISAPDCDTHGQDEHIFRLRKGQDSPVFYFQLTPRMTGRIGIIVTVYQEQEWLLGMTRLHTDVQEQLSGTVEMNIESRPIVINNYGDTYNMSGEFNGSNLNIKSTLKDVNQTINRLPRINGADKADLQRRIAQLNRVLQEVPPEKREEADAMAQMVDALIKSADEAKPNIIMMEITGEGLKQAAKNLAKIVPDVVKIAGAIVAGMFGLA